MDAIYAREFPWLRPVKNSNNVKRKDQLFYCNICHPNGSGELAKKKSTWQKHQQGKKHQDAATAVNQPNQPTIKTIFKPTTERVG